MKGIPCADLELERRWLAAAASVPDVATDPAKRVPAHDFAHSEHQAMALDIYAIADSGEDVNSVAVLTRADKRGRKRQAWEILDADAVLGSEAATTAAHLRTLARARRIREGLLAAVSACEAGEPDEALKLAGEMDEPLGAVARHRAGTAHDAMGVAFAAIEDGGRGDEDAMAIGFPVVDRAITGLRPRTMTIIGGTTNAGKSQLCLAIALNMVLRRGFPVGIVSCEDPEEVWGERLLADGAKMSTSERDPASVEAFRRAVEQARGLGLHFEYPLNLPLAATLASMRSLAAKGCRVIMVDYLQAIRLGATAARHDLVIGTALQDIKGLAQQLGVALVVASQFSRPDKAKPFAEPYMTSLKESSTLEQSAEIIALLWKDGDDDNAKTIGKIVKVKWSGKRPRFIVERHPNTGLIVGLSEYTPPPPKDAAGSVVKRLRDSAPEPDWRNA